MNDNDRDTLNALSRLLDEGQAAENEFLNELARTKPVASSNIKARIEDRLISELAERKREKVNANGHFELDFVTRDEEIQMVEPHRRSKPRLSLTMAASLLIVLFAGILLVMFSGDEPKRGGQSSQSELLTQSPTVIPYVECPRYTVTENDTCETIAQQFNTAVDELIAANNLSLQCNVRFGQVLVIPQDYCVPTNPTNVFATVQPLPDELAETPQPSPTRPPPPTPYQYIFQQGDSCESIAAAFDVPVEDVILYNGMGGCRNFRPGQVVSVPLTPSPNTPQFSQYIVQNGDTCGSIAAALNVDVNQLISINGVDPQCLALEVGQVLDIPPSLATPLVSLTPIPYQTLTVSDQDFLPVVIALVDLQPGTLITSENVGVVYYPETMFPADAYPSLSYYYGLIVTSHIPKYVPLSTTTTSLAVELTPLVTTTPVSPAALSPSPTVAPPIAPTPTECPPASTPERSLDSAPMQQALSAALETPVEVTAIGLQNCPDILEPSAAWYTVNVPQIEGMSDAEIVETVVYALPADTLLLPGSITLVISDRTSPGFSLDINAVRTARDQNLHGQQLMDALDLLFVVATPTPQSTDIEVTLTPDPRITPTSAAQEPQTTIVVPLTQPRMWEGRVSNGDPVQLQFVGTVETICAGQEPIPDLVMAECEQSSANPTRQLSFRTPSLVNLGMEDNEDVVQVTFATDFQSAATIRWLLDEEIRFTASQADTGNVEWTRGLCLTEDELQVAFDPVRLAMEAAFTTSVNVHVSTTEDCVTDQDFRRVFFSVSVPAPETISATQVIETVVYAFPEAYLPDRPLVGVGGNLLIWTGTLEQSVSGIVDLHTLFSVRRQELHGQVLVDALGIDMLSNQSSVFIPVSDGIIETVDVGDAVSIEITYDVDAACFGQETVPDAMQTICSTYADSGQFGAYETPLVAIAGFARVAAVPNLIVRTDADTAAIITWMLEQEAIDSIKIDGLEVLESGTLPSDQVGIEIGLTSDMAENITVGDTLALYYAGADFDGVCNPQSSTTPPELIQQECERFVQSTEIDSISLTTPSLVIVDLTLLPPDGLRSRSTATLAADPQTAEAITWLNGRIIPRYTHLTTDSATNPNPTWITAQCPSTADYQFALDNAQASFQSALNDALEGVTVTVGDAEVCPDLSQSISIWYQVRVPSNTNLSDMEIIEAVVYAMPEESLLQQPFTTPQLGISVWIGERENAYNIGDWTLKTALDQELSGQALMDALGLDLRIPSGQVGIEIGLTSDLAEIITVGDMLRLRYTMADFDTVCNPPESVPELIQQECESSFRSFNTRSISFTAPSLMVAEIIDHEGMTTATLNADPATAEAIAWLTEQQVTSIIRLNGDRATNTTWNAEECLTDEAVHAILESAVADLQNILDSALTDDIEVSIESTEFCPDLSGPFSVWYRVAIRPTSASTHTEIIQAAVYAIPYEIMPQYLFTSPFDGITIAIGEDENAVEYAINFSTLKTARDRGFGGQTLMDALGLESRVE